MLLRNKKTGEIHEITEVMSLSRLEKRIVLYSETDKCNYKYTSLAELNSEWEDYEELKGIKSVGNIGSSVHIEMGTKEEAERAVEKLKALKRLKDNGFRFCGGDDACISYKTDIENWSMQDLQDFNTLFGGEE